MTETWLRECDHHLIPVKPDFLAISGLEYLRRFRSRNPEMGFANHLGIVINMMEQTNEADRAMAAHLHEDVELRCFEAAVPMASIIQSASLYSPDHRSYSPNTQANQAGPSAPSRKNYWRDWHPRSRCLHHRNRRSNPRH